MGVINESGHFQYKNISNLKGGFWPDELFKVFFFCMPPLKQCGIYKITNSINGKFYIGSSVDIHKRWISHKCYLNKQLHPNKHIQNAFNVYGFECFKHEVIELCDKEVIQSREQYYIDLLYDKEKCYNIFKEAYAVNGKNHPMFGRTHTPEARLKIKEARAKQIISHSKETRLKMGLASKGRKMSPESIEKNRQAKLGKPSWNKGKSNMMGAYMNRFKLNGCKGLELINDYFSGLSLISLSNKHNMSWGNCANYLERNNVKIRTISEQSKLNHARKFKQN